MTLLKFRVWHPLKPFLALQGTVATCKARSGELSDVKVFDTKFFWHVSVKIYQIRWHLANLLHAVKEPLIKTMYM